jgi:hypothetical protein
MYILLATCTGHGIPILAYSEDMNSKNTAKLLVGMVLIYSLSYLVVGALAYALITKQFYIGDHPIFTSYLRSESSPDLWSHVMIWQFPILLLRSLLIALVLLPFIATLKKMSLWRCAGVIFALLFILTHIAAAAPSSGNLEGVVYVTPELLSTKTFLLVQPEMIIQSIIVGIGFAFLIKKHSKVTV